MIAHWVRLSVWVCLSRGQGLWFGQGCGISFQRESIVELLIPLKPPQTMQWKLLCGDVQGSDLLIVREAMHFPTYSQFCLLY